MSKSGKTLVEFNVKNGQYKTGDGTLKSLTWLTKVALEADVGESVIFGDGEEVLTLPNDKGYNVTLGMTAPDLDFEKDNGLCEEITGGIANIQRQSRPENAIYFETQYAGADGTTKTKKVWLFGVTVSKPSITFDQNTDNPNASTVEYAGKVRGTNLKAVGGAKDYIDPTTGNTIKVFRLSAIPTDSGYADFGSSVPVPTVLTPPTPPSGGET